MKARLYPVLALSPMPGGKAPEPQAGLYWARSHATFMAE